MREWCMTGFFFFKQKTAYEIKECDWSSDVCSSDLTGCNVKKGGRTPRQAGMTLIQKPVKPKRNPLVHIHLGYQRYSGWKQFLDNAYWSVELK